MVEPNRAASGIDTSVPNAARMYDYWLGGKDNFAADRRAADMSARAVPQMPWLAVQNRKFLGRVVRFCANAGIDQFLDIGSGLPTMENVHQVARRIVPDARVVYVDNDPVVVNHAQALIVDHHTAAILGDATRPGEILAAPAVRELIDFSQPVALLLVAVLHFVMDEDDPIGAVAKLCDEIAPGSYLAVSHVETSPDHVVGTQPKTDTGRELAEARKGMAETPARTRDDIMKFFGGLPLVEPGLVDVWLWRPDSKENVNSSDVMTVLGGVARKD